MCSVCGARVEARYPHWLPLWYNCDPGRLQLAPPLTKLTVAKATTHNSRWLKIWFKCFMSKEIHPTNFLALMERQWVLEKVNLNICNTISIPLLLLKISRWDFWFIVRTLFVNHCWPDARKMSNTKYMIHALSFRKQFSPRCLSLWSNSPLIRSECKNDFFFPVSVINFKSTVEHDDTSVHPCHGNFGVQTSKD